MTEKIDAIEIWLCVADVRPEMADWLATPATFTLALPLRFQAFGPFEPLHGEGPVGSTTRSWLEFIRTSPHREDVRARMEEIFCSIKLLTREVANRALPSTLRLVTGHGQLSGTLVNGTVENCLRPGRGKYEPASLEIRDACYGGAHIKAWAKYPRPFIGDQDQTFAFRVGADTTAVPRLLGSGRIAGDCLTGSVLLGMAACRGWIAGRQTIKNADELAKAIREHYHSLDYRFSSEATPTLVEVNADDLYSQLFALSARMVNPNGLFAQDYWTMQWLPTDERTVDTTLSATLLQQLCAMPSRQGATYQYSEDDIAELDTLLERHFAPCHLRRAYSAIMRIGLPLSECRQVLAAARAAAIACSSPNEKDV
eukprot:TRINITY_DN53851_c0_g1_i1.p1 TRINITY_DN53851_c0_g1~~TRINITY_DN53851_c0_g1_i1.p1  ORF type:complete len:369 (-),score=41.65 TRINITY_DN53851_c0_g1_i1:167-1273(-)